MAAQIFLSTPPDAEANGFPARLAVILAAAEISALLVLRHGLDDQRYAALVTAILPAAQKAGCAVLVDNDAALAIALHADGVHLAPDVKIVKAAIAKLKPNMIVGVGPFESRHDAMTIGELDVDYLLFGAFDHPASETATEMAAWWAETFEVPAVLVGGDALASPAEFIAPASGLWSDPAPERTIAALAGALQA